MFQKTTIDLRKSSLKIYFRFKKSQVSFFLYILFKNMFQSTEQFSIYPDQKGLIF